MNCEVKKEVETTIELNMTDDSRWHNDGIDQLMAD